MKPSFLLMGLTAATAAALLATRQVMPKQPQEPLRDAERLCSEVRVELMIHVAEYPDSMTISEVNRITQKCLRNLAK